MCFQPIRTLEDMVLKWDDLPAKCLQDRNACEQQFARGRTALAPQLGRKGRKTDCTCKGGQQRSYDQKGRMTDNTELLQRN